MAYCEMCDNKRGFLSVWKTKDGRNICVPCMKLVSRGDEEFYNNLYDHCSEITFSEWEEYIKNPVEAQKWNYSERPIITKIGDVMFEDRKQIISIPCGFLGASLKDYHYSQIHKYEYIENHSSVSTGGSGIGRALVGGMMFGGAGAIVGAATKKRTYEEVASNMYIRIVFIQDNQPVVETIKISDMFDGKISLDSWTYERYINRVEKLMFKLDEAYAMSHNEELEQKKVTVKEDNLRSVSNSIDITQQLKQLKELYEQELITEEEYAKQRQKILDSYDFSSRSIQKESNDKKDLDVGCSIQEKSAVMIEKTQYHRIGNIQFNIIDEECLTERNQKIWEQICSFLETPKNKSENYLISINEIALSSNSIATSENNSYVYHLALNKVQEKMYKDEIPMFFADDGLISHNAKVGYFVTNKHIFFINKNHVVSFDLSQLFSINAPRVGGSWRINDDTSNVVSEVPWGNIREYALNMAFILQLYVELVGEDVCIMMKGR